MKTFGLILLIVGLLSTGLAASQMTFKKSSTNFDPLTTTTRWTTLDDSALATLDESTLAALVLLGTLASFLSWQKKIKLNTTNIDRAKK